MKHYNSRKKFTAQYASKENENRDLQCLPGTKWKDITITSWQTI